MYITLVQTDFRYIRTIWFQGSTFAQPEIFIFIVKWHISRNTFTLHATHNFHYIRKNMISVVFPFLLCVNILLHIHISYLYLCLKPSPCLKWFLSLLKMFLSFHLSIIAFFNSFVLKLLLLCRKIFFLRGAFLFNSFKNAVSKSLQDLLVEWFSINSNFF